MVGDEGKIRNNFDIYYEISERCKETALEFPCVVLGNEISFVTNI